MTKAKPLRKNWTEEEALPAGSGTDVLLPIEDAEVDGLFEDENFLMWLDEKISESDKNPEPPVSLAEARDYFRVSFADMRRKGGR